MSQLRQTPSCSDHDPARIFSRWGLLRCELLDRNAFDAALNSLSADFEPPSDPALMADYLLQDGVATLARRLRRTASGLPRPSSEIVSRTWRQV